MLLLTSTSDLIQVITGSAGDIDVHASWLDNAAGTITAGRTNTASISTAATTTVVAAPASSVQRNVKHLSVFNGHASVSNLVTIQHTDGTNVEIQWKGTLLPGEAAVLDATGKWTHYDANGVAYAGTIFPINLYNASVSAQSPFSSDTYLVGSNIALPSTLAKVKSLYLCTFDVTKTAAGTAAATVIVRFGTGGAVGDAAILTFTFPAQSGVVDVGRFTVRAVFRTIGSGTLAVLQGRCDLEHNLAVTGLATVNPAGMVPLLVTSSGFNSAVANSIIGLSVNGGASAAWTIQMVETRMNGL